MAGEQRAEERVLAGAGGQAGRVLAGAGGQAVQARPPRSQTWLMGILFFYPQAMVVLDTFSLGKRSGESCILKLFRIM